MPEKDEIEFQEEWSRKVALRLWNQLHPKNKSSYEDFFVRTDLNQLKDNDVLLENEGDADAEGDTRALGALPHATGGPLAGLQSGTSESGRCHRRLWQRTNRH